jgi:hypothetical protein
MLRGPDHMAMRRMGTLITAEATKNLPGGWRGPRISGLSATARLAAVLIWRRGSRPSALILAERQWTMKQLFALAALGLFAAVPLSATGSTLVPPDRFPAKPQVLSGIGRLTPAEDASPTGWRTLGLPRWQVRLGEDTYYVVFEGKMKEEMEKLAERLSGNWVLVSGRVERRTFEMVRRCNRAGTPFFKDPRVTALNVLVVDGLTDFPMERVKPAPSVRVTLTAQVHYVGNAYSRMPDGSIIGTLRGHPWEGCYIVLNGRTVRLVGLPGDMVDQQGYRGQTLVLVGRLEHRPTRNPAVPGDVLVVESFRRA